MTEWIPIPELADQKYKDRIGNVNERLSEGEILRLEVSNKPDSRQTVLAVRQDKIFYCPVVDGSREVLEFSKKELQDHTTGLPLIIALCDGVERVDNPPRYIPN